MKEAGSDGISKLKIRQRVVHSLADYYFPGNIVLFIFFYFFLPVFGFHAARAGVVRYHGVHGPEVCLHAGFGVFIFYGIFFFDANALGGLGRVNVGA